MATQPTAIVTQSRASAVVSMADRFGIEPHKVIDILKGTVIGKDKNGKEATTEMVAAFIVVSNQYGLNPFTREIYAFPDPNRGGIVPIVSVDGWCRIINNEQRLDGIEFSELHDDKGRLISTTCTIHVKERSHPVRVTEYFSECFRNTKPWNDMPHRMLRHKALIQCARVAFSLGGIYDEDEANDIIAGRLESRIADDTRQVAAALTAPQRVTDPLPVIDVPAPAQQPAQEEAPQQAEQDPRLPAERARIQALVAELGASCDEVADVMVGLGLSHVGDLDRVLDCKMLEEARLRLEQVRIARAQQGGSLIPNNEPLPQVEPKLPQGVSRRK